MCKYQCTNAGRERLHYFHKPFLQTVDRLAINTEGEFSVIVMSIASDVIASEVIDWDEAMEQCGDDEEFLRELLADLRDETDTQVAKIEETIRNPTEQPFHRIMRASHVIKGAASNLMCQQLRQAAMELEQAASNANDLDQNASGAAMSLVKTKYMDLKEATENYQAFLRSISV